MEYYLPALKIFEEIGDKILASPELGFKEHKTAELVAQTMKQFGFESVFEITHMFAYARLAGV